MFDFDFNFFFKKYGSNKDRTLDHLFKESLILCHDQSFQKFNLLDEGIPMALKHF